MLLLIMSFAFSSVIPFVFAYICLCISLISLFPLEYLIRKYYYQKAKKKLKKINPLIVGITGSYGKTSFRNYLKDFLSIKYKVISPNGNINTPMGLCKFINQTNITNDSIIIFELGIDTVNGMNRFKHFLKLDYAFITSIGNNHLSSFKTKNNILKGKLKIKELLKDKSNIYVNGEDEILKELDPSYKKFNSIKIDNIKITYLGISFSYDDHLITLPIYSDYIIQYLGGIVILGKKLNMSQEEITLGIKNIKPIDRRMNVKKWENGYIIDDSYNINLLGVKSSLKILSLFEGKSVVITGGIVEQGKEYINSNIELANLLKDYEVVFIGDNMHPLNKGKFKYFHRENKLSEAISFVQKLGYNNILLLAKGEDIYLK